MLVDAWMAAKMLGGICEKTLWTWTKPRGDLRCYPTADIRAWLSQHAQDARPCAEPGISKGRTEL